MADWKLELNEDLLRKKHPGFLSLEERIAGYRAFYLSGGAARDSKHPAPSPDTPREDSPDANSRDADPPGTNSPGADFPAASDTRRSAAPFSTLLSFYEKDGTECTFSRQGMRRVQRKLPWQGHYHTHDYIEILYVASGSFEQVLLGERQTFGAGEFVITDRALEHADCLSGAEDACVLFLWLQADYLDHLLSSYDRENELQRFFFHALRRQRREQSYIHLRPLADGGISEAGTPADGISPAKTAGAAGIPSANTTVSPGSLPVILERLIQEDYFPQEGSDDMIRGNLLRLLAVLSRDYAIRLHSSDQESREQAFLYELERYIRLHFQEITSADLERQFHYHRNYFNLLLQKYRGVSYQKYIQNVRMNHAAALLRGTELSIKEIALRCGYHNSSHFYHLFEKKFGVSPAQYRRADTP